MLLVSVTSVAAAESRRDRSPMSDEPIGQPNKVPVFRNMRATRSLPLPFHRGAQRDGLAEQRPSRDVRGQARREVAPLTESSGRRSATWKP